MQLFVYDLRDAPLTFDITNFLAVCYGFLKYRGIDRGKLVIVKSDEARNSIFEDSYSREYREFKLFNVLLRCASLCDFIDELELVAPNSWVRPPDAFPPSGVRPYSPKYFDFFLDRGIDIRCFSAGQRVLQWATRLLPEPEKWVSISPRSANYNGSRNSSMVMWRQVSERIRTFGFRTIFIPDQDFVINNPRIIDGEFDIVCPEACFDVELRLAIYATCRDNLCWTGGHTAPLALSKYPFELFGLLNHQNPVANENFFARKGPSQGEHPRWLDPHTQFYNWLEHDKVTSEYIFRSFLSRVRKNDKADFG